MAENPRPSQLRHHWLVMPRATIPKQAKRTAQASVQASVRGSNTAPRPGARKCAATPLAVGNATASNDARLLVTLSAGDLAHIVRRELESVLSEAELDAARPPIPLLTKRGLAGVLQVSERTIDNLRRQGLPTIQLLGTPRFELGECLAWLKTRDRDTAQPEAGCKQAPVSAPLRLVHDGGD